jgi:Ca2+-binding RTX toxin-like protein
MPSVLGDGADNTVTVSRDGPGKRRGRRRLGRERDRGQHRQNPGARPGRSDISSPDEASGALPAANLFGRAGNDALTGGPGNDQRYGQAGNDTLLGGNGHGVPNGGPGRDRLNAAPGDDTVIQ